VEGGGGLHAPTSTMHTSCGALLSTCSCSRCINYSHHDEGGGAHGKITFPKPHSMDIWWDKATMSTPRLQYAIPWELAVGCQQTHR